MEYALKNAAVNGIGNAEAVLSNGFEQLGDRRFDVVASNLPAKAGNEALFLLFEDARTHLRPGGRFYVVTISGLRRFVDRAFTEVFGNYEKVKQGRTHTVSLAMAPSDG